MARTSGGAGASALALASVLTLAACSSHSGSSASGTSTTSGAAASASSAVASASTVVSNGASQAPQGSTTPSATAPSAPASATTSAPSTPSATIPVTVTSPGSTPTATTSATPTATTTSTAAGSSTRCRNAQLKVSLGTEGAAAGSRYTPLVFTNTGSASCTLSGHPGVSYVAGDKGVQVGDSATRDPGTVRTVTLAPGGSASALIHEANYENFDQSVCKPVSTRGFRVYPPGSTAAFFVARADKECSGTSLPATALSIGVVKPGTDPSA